MKYIIAKYAHLGLRPCMLWVLLFGMLSTPNASVAQDEFHSRIELVEERTVSQQQSTLSFILSNFSDFSSDTQFDKNALHCHNRAISVKLHENQSLHYTLIRDHFFLQLKVLDTSEEELIA